jgi:hypothetical protein
MHEPISPKPEIIINAPYNKVFCNHCLYLRGWVEEEDRCVHPNNIKDTSQGPSSTTRRNPAYLNEYNDCAWFTPKPPPNFWQRIRGCRY